MFYAVFRMIVTTSFTPLTKELGATLEGGFTCGCAATLYYVVWKNFFRQPNDETLSPAFLSKTLRPYIPETVTQGKFEALRLLVKEFLVSLRTLPES